MKKWIAAPILALAFVTSSASCFAQAASPAKLALARQVVQLQNGAEQETLFADLAQGASSVLVAKWNNRAIDALPESKREGVRAQLNAELQVFYNDILKILRAESKIVESQDLANLYAEKFTEDELKALIAWFKSPAFKRYQEVAPELASAYLSKLLERAQGAVQDRQGAFDAKAAAFINNAKK